MYIIYISYFSSACYPSPLRKAGACSVSLSVGREVCQVRLRHYVIPRRSNVPPRCGWASSR